MRTHFSVCSFKTLETNQSRKCLTSRLLAQDLHPLIAPTLAPRPHLSHCIRHTHNDEETSRRLKPIRISALPQSIWWKTSLPTTEANRLLTRFPVWSPNKSGQNHPRSSLTPALWSSMTPSFCRPLQPAILPLSPGFGVFASKPPPGGTPQVGLKSGVVRFRTHRPAVSRASRECSCVFVMVSNSSTKSVPR